MTMVFRDVDRGWKRLGDFLKRHEATRPHVKVGVMGPAAVAIHGQSRVQSFLTRAKNATGWDTRRKPTVVEIASYNEFGTGSVVSLRSGGMSVNTPERSFIRATFDRNQSKYVTAMRNGAERITRGIATQKMILEAMGQLVQSDMQGRIEMGIPPPNDPVTIKRKGSSKPLVDTGQLKGSITYVTEGA